MATKKFAQPSPYSLALSHPASDYLYEEYTEQVTQRSRPKFEPAVAAIFGLGRAGSIHLSNLLGNPRVQLKYIVDDLPGKWADIRTYWDLKADVVFLTSKDAHKVYKDPAVNVVIVASPTYTHEEIVISSLDNNKHVFCEKPIAENIEQTMKCYDKAKKTGKTLFAAFNRRFDPAYRTLKDRVRSGDIGHAQILRVTSRDSPLPSIEYLKVSGGVFHDCLVHDIDMSTWILGELPIKVQASASALIPEIKAIDDFDTISFLMTFPSGTIAIGDNSRFSPYGYDQRLEAFGAKGMIKVENEQPCSSTEFVHKQDGIKYNPIYYSFPSRYRLAYANEMKHFLDVVQYGAECEVKSWQTYATSVLATALETSARTGETVFLDWSDKGIPTEYAP